MYIMVTCIYTFIYMYIPMESNYWDGTAGHKNYRQEFAQSFNLYKSQGLLIHIKLREASL